MVSRFGFVTLAVIACLAKVQSAPSIGTESVCTSGKLDLVLVIDVSGSNQHRFEANRGAALDIVHSLPIGWNKVIVAVIQYSKQAVMKLQFGSSQSSEMVNETIWSLDWTGGVALGAEAMDLAMIQFRRSRHDADRVIILLSDGNSLNKWAEVQAAAERLKYSHSKIFAVSLGGNTYEPELKAYVGQSNGTIVKSQSELDTLKKELLKYTVSACRTVESPKIDTKHGEESWEHLGKTGKSSESSKERIKSSEGISSAERILSSHNKTMSGHMHNSTRHDHVTHSSSKRTTTFSKKTTASTRTSSRSTRRPISRSSSLKTTRHVSILSGEVLSPEAKNSDGILTVTPTHAHTRTTVITSSTNETSPRVPTTIAIETSTPDATSATISDIFDSVGRQEAIEKMIDNAHA